MIWSVLCRALMKRAGKSSPGQRDNTQAQVPERRASGAFALLTSGLGKRHGEVAVGDARLGNRLARKVRNSHTEILGLEGEFLGIE
jgi:hypothetical protein